MPATSSGVKRTFIAPRFSPTRSMRLVPGIAGRRARLIRHLAVEQREFALHRGDRVHRMGALDALGACLAEPEKTHLTLFDKPAHRADRVLDRHTRVDPLLVIEVDRIDPEPLEARLAGLLDIFGAAVDAARAAVLAEFGREYDVVAPPLGQGCQRPAKQLLVLAQPIGVRAVEKIDAKLDRPLQKWHRRVVVARPVGPGQRHAAEPDRRNLEPVAAEPAAL